MAKNIPDCPRCGSNDVVRNGRTRHGWQNFRCKACGRQFCLDPKRRVSGEIEEVVDRMIRGGEKVATIIEYTGVSAGFVYARRREFK